MPATILVVEDEPAIRRLVAATPAARRPRRQVPAPTAPRTLRLVRLDLPTSCCWTGSTARHERPAVRTPAARRRARARPADHHAHRAQRGTRQGRQTDAGADNYLTKPFSPRELQARIKAVRRRAPQISRGLRRNRRTARQPGEPPHAHGAGKPIELGPTEFRLLHFLMTHTEPCTPRRVARPGLGDHVFVRSAPVNVHIRRLRASLEANWARPPDPDRARQRLPASAQPE